MMKAESDGLVEINIELQNEEGYTRRLYDYITSENVSDIADAWNKERKDVVDLAMAKFRVMFQKNVKDELRTACEDAVASECRRNYSKVNFFLHFAFRDFTYYLISETRPSTLQT